MSAFISHSSKDKAFVGQVAQELGSLQVEYDEQSFEFTFNVQAIRQALKRASIVAFFVSANSMSSSFVQEEQRQTLEALGRGSIKRVVIFCIDGSSFRDLPAWMQEINIARTATNAKACARRIQAMLLETDAADPLDDIYLGREEEESHLRKALAVPRSVSPIYLHVSGFHGVGRRTFLRNSLRRALPRYYESFIELTTSQYQGVEDLYRSLYQLHVVASLSETIEAFESFSEMEAANQAVVVASLIGELSDDGSLVIVVDEFAVFDEEGDYQSYWKDILQVLSDRDRPAVAFVQSRMQPFNIRNTYRRTFHARLRELSDSDSRDVIALSLKAEDVDFDEDQLNQLAELVDGHPFNLRFAVGYAKHYGLSTFLSDPRDFIEWKHRRGEDFLKKLDFSERQLDIVAALAEYRYMSAELLLAVTGSQPDDLMSDIRSLQDFCCVEYRNEFFHLASPIREAIRRDPRFAHSDAWHRAVAQVICQTVSEYSEEEHVPLSIIESATLAQARGAAAPAYLRSLILPSHLLMIAREHYDRHLRPQCIEFCKRAYEMKSRMTMDAQVETLRLWGLSATRSNDATEYGNVIRELSAYNYPTATRVKLFLEGFNARLRGLLVVAETKFKAAWELAPRNPHINRELASLYCRQKRYGEAEQFARSTYDIQRTNAYIIDILLETLLGKKSNGQSVDEGEIARLRDELRTHSRDSDTLFYNLREAQARLSSRDYNGAAREVEEAIRINGSVPAAYFLGVEIELRRSNVSGAQSYFDRVSRLLEKQGQSEGDECKLAEAKVDILAERRQFLAAKSVLDQSSTLPAPFLSRLSRSLARSISFDPTNSTRELNQWANKQLSR